MLLMETPVAKQIGLAVVEHHGRYLVGMRSADQVLGGCAEFPGGKCEPQECPSDCAVRECFEETGLTVIAERRLDTIGFAYAHGAVELHFWLCRPVGKIEADHHGFRWVPAKQLTSLSFPEANRPIIEQLARQHPSHSG